MVFDDQDGLTLSCTFITGFLHLLFLFFKVDRSVHV